MYKLLKQLHTVSFLFSLLLQLSVEAYELPTPKINVYYPKGFEVSISDEPGITHFAFHGKLNEVMEGLELGTVAGDVPKMENERWTFRDTKTKVNIGDILVYWIYVKYQDLDYRPNIFSHFEVIKYANRTIVGGGATSGILRNCAPTTTVMNGGQSAECSGQMLFEEEFSGTFLDVDKWQLERRFPTQPDYEFVMYLENEPDVVTLTNGTISIRPKATILSSNPISKDLLTEYNMGRRCTGRRETEECHCKPSTGSDIIPPFISAQFSTKTKFSFKYGRVEIRAKLPCIEWALPQLWLEPVKRKYGWSNYQSGQVRIAYSSVNASGAQLKSNLIVNADKHWRTTNICHVPTAANWCDDFRVYQLTWTREFMAVAVDGKEYCRWTGREIVAYYDVPVPNYNELLESARLAPFAHEFYVTLGYGIGGHNDFEDEFEDEPYGWKNQKPWTNFDPKAMKKFWKSVENDINERQPNDELIIDYVRVYAD